MKKKSSKPQSPKGREPSAPVLATLFFFPLILASAFLNMGPTCCGSNCPPSAPPIAPGRIPGVHGVDDNGGATYDIAIEVPDGRNGLQPSLSLHYSSQADNGILGVGWSLVGTSSIHRCNQTYAHDGEARGIVWNDNTDAYCLDGQRLEEVGVGFAPEGNGFSVQYKVINNGRDRIQYYNDGSGIAFHLTRPDGTQYWYGGGYNAEVKASGDGPQVTYAWLLRKVEDLYGNTIGYTYNSDGRLVRVLYGANYAAGETSHPRRVELVYEDRPDPIIRSVSSRTYPRLDKRLRAIEVYTGTTLVRSYGLAYKQSGATQRSILLSVEHCDSGGLCQTKTSFNWAEDKNRSTISWQITNSDAPAGDPRVFGDFDGDGKTELMQPGFCGGEREFVIRNWDPPTSPAFVSNGGTYLVAPGIPPTLCTGHAVNGDEALYPFDHDHDGFVSVVNAKPEVAYIFPGGVPTFESTFKFITGAEAPMDLVYTAGGSGADLCGMSESLLSGDLNGDGQTDLFTYCRAVPLGYSETRFLQVNCGVPGGFLPPEYCVFSELPPINGQDPGADKTIALLDVDGDGVVEATRSINGERVLITDPSTGLGAGHYLSRVMADVNNDGLLDNFDFDNDRIDLAGGTTGQTLNLPGFEAPIVPSALRLADLDRDGMVDMVYLHPDTASDQIEIYWGTPNSDTPFDTNDKTVLDNYICYPRVGNPSQCDSDANGPQAFLDRFTHHVQLVDMDGDGNPEVTYRQPGTPNDIFVVEFNSDPVDMIEWVRDGAREPKFYYDDISSESGYYTAGTNCLHHQTCGTFDLSVAVFVAESTTGVTTTYGYKDARFDRQGSGWLGFGEVSSETTIDDAVITTTRRFDHDNVGTGANRRTYPYSGLPVYESRNVFDTLGGTSERTTTTTTYEVVALPDGGSVTVPDFTETKNQRFCFSGCPPEGILLERATVDYGYDAYGFVATTTQSWYESPELLLTTTTNENIVTPDQYIVGRPTFVDEVHTSDFVNFTTRSRELRYDAQGGLERIIYEPLSQDERLDVSLVRDDVGMVQTRSQTDGFNVTRSRTYVYDGNRIRPATITDGGLTHTFEFDDGLDAVTKYVDPAAVTYEYEYDGFGRQKRMLINGQQDSTTTYTRLSAEEQTRVSTIYRNRPATETTYDRLGRPEVIRTKAFDGSWTRVTRAFNQMGLVTMETVPSPGVVLGATTLTYDALGRTTSVTAPDGKTETYSYDPVQNSVTITPPGQAARTMKYDGRGRLVQSSDAVSGTTMSYAYAVGSNLAQIEDNRGNTWSYQHDRFGRVTQSVDPDRGLHKYRYNGFGDLVHEEDGQQRAIDYYYDSIGRPVFTNDYEGWTAYYYDSAAANAEGKIHRIERSGDNTQIDVRYTASGLTESVAKVIDGTSYQTSYQYDSSERLSRIDYPTVNGKSLAVYLDYNLENHLEVVRDATVSREYWRLQETDAWGRPTNIYVPGGQHIRSYDPISGRLDSSAVSTSGTGGYEHIYQYNVQGSVSRKERLGTSPRFEDYTYDSLGRLDSWELTPPVGTSQLHDYQYDALGNITQNAFGALDYNKTGNAGPHAVTSAAGTSYSYDVNGHRTQATGAQQWKASYTHRGVARAFTELNNDPIVEYTYDPLGKKVKRVSHNPSETSIFIDNLAEKHASADGEFTIFRVHAMGEEVARVVYQDGAAIPAVLGVANDELGSSSTFIQEATGIATTSFHDPWGNLIDENGNQVAWTDPEPSARPTFTGHRYTDVGMIDMGGRVYDPKTSQFLTGDPVVLAATATAQGFNSYAYVLNQPTRFTDPTGFLAVRGTNAGVDAGLSVVLSVCAGGWIACGFAAAGYAIYHLVKYWKTIKNWFKNWGNRIKNRRARRRETKPYQDPSNRDATSTSGTPPQGESPSGGTGSSGNVNFVAEGYESFGTGEERRNLRPRVADASGGVSRDTKGKDARGPYGSTLLEFNYGANQFLGTVSDFLFGPTTWSNCSSGTCVDEPVYGGTPFGGPRSFKSGIDLLRKAPLHHLCTNKNCVSLLRGGPWTPRFEKLFKGAGMTLDDGLNQVRIPGHFGPHPEAYHRAVFRRLDQAVQGLRGGALRIAMRFEWSYNQSEKTPQGKAPI